MSSAIHTERLTKDYGLGRGLFQLDLDVAEGEVFGYLGPNGAGKTTTIRLLMGAIHPTSGRAEVFGIDCWRAAVQTKRSIGYLPGELPQFGSLRGSQVVTSLARLREGVDPDRVARLATRLDLDLGRRCREYSRGNKQKLGLVLAFMHEPRLLILDEPTAGLDPLNQQEFYRMVSEASDRGATVFLSSHVLSEVDHVCSRVGIIRSGRLVQVAGLADLHHIRFHRVEIEFAGAPPLEAVKDARGVADVEADGRRLTCSVQGDFGPLLAAIGTNPVVNLVSHEPNLEEVFLAYYREPEAAADEASVP